MKKILLDVISRFGGARVVVLADLVLDEFVHGEIARVSREAPVLIIDYKSMDAMPGGGANAIRNVRALGGEPVPVGVVGSDEAGERLIALLAQDGIDTAAIEKIPNYATPVKTRVLAGLPHSRPQQVIRIDRGGTGTVGAGIAEAAAQRAASLLTRETGALLFSDYGYDVVTPDSAARIMDKARGIGLTVTCDSRHRLKGYKGVTAVTPNLEEAEEMLGVRLSDGPERLRSAGRELLARVGCKAVLITRGSRGMTLLEDGVAPFEIPVFGSDQVADVTGAGDTVIAAFTLALATGSTFRVAAMLANVAAGLVVMKRGTATVTAAELIDAVDRIAPDAA